MGFSKLRLGLSAALNAGAGTEKNEIMASRGLCAVAHSGSAVAVFTLRLWGKASTMEAPGITLMVVRRHDLIRDMRNRYKVRKQAAAH